MNKRFSSILCVFFSENGRPFFVFSHLAFQKVGHPISESILKKITEEMQDVEALFRGGKRIK